MQPKLESSFALLERTPAAVDALLRGLPEAWVMATEGEKTWSARDIVGHLIHCEHTDWMPRARSILVSDGVTEFPPFDRSGHVQAIEGKPLEQLLEEFAEIRATNLIEARGWNLRPEELALRGRHPALGEVTLDELLATWAAHDLNHLHQLTRVLAHQYREAVGPFQSYLGVLHCDGHGT
jgi:hypothetical protein